MAQKLSQVTYSRVILETTFLITTTPAWLILVPTLGYINVSSVHFFNLEARPSQPSDILFETPSKIKKRSPTRAKITKHDLKKSAFVSPVSHLKGAAIR